MNVIEVLDWTQCEERKTSYAAGIRAYDDQMLLKYRWVCVWLEADMPTTYADIEKVLLEWSEDFDIGLSELPADARLDVDSQEAGY